MAATSPITSIWTPTSKRLCCLWCHLVVPAGCRIATCRPLIAPPSCPLVYQLVVALPLTVLSLHCPLVILSCQLVVALPLAVLSLCHPLVNSSCQLVVASSLLVLLLHPNPPSRPLITPSGCCVASRHTTLLSACHLIVPPHFVSLRQLIVTPSSLVVVAPPSRRPLIVLAGCCIACPWAALSSSRHSP